MSGIPGKRNNLMLECELKNQSARLPADALRAQAGLPKRFHYGGQASALRASQ